MRVMIDTLPQMRLFAESVAAHLGAGDLLILSGNLGAGKTTFTQALGKSLGVQGRITSPTFIIAREHPPIADGPALVHVDAYRLADPGELEDLDLDSELEESVTVVEWGAGLAEQLSSDYLSIAITLPETEAAWMDDSDADDPDAEADEDEGRIVELVSQGASWSTRFEEMLRTFRAAGLSVTQEQP